MDKFLSHKRTFDDNKASTSGQTSTVPKIKSRKYSHEYLNFGFTITELNGEEKPLCVICSKILAADSVKPNKLKRHFETLHAICKKPHTIAEELILPAAIGIVETMFGDNFTKELQSIPLSNDTVSRRIDDIAEDVEQQLFGKFRDKLFSIQLVEITDSNKDAHFIAYVRFWDDEIYILSSKQPSQKIRFNKGRMLKMVIVRSAFVFSAENSSSTSTPKFNERFITKLRFIFSLDVKSMKISSSEVKSPSGVF
ncbi:SCAN domain-containing protein 3 [Trichonephila clavipes]|nr:SCAN domain-containing protein 3 [Trichonephila clavipes]